MNADPGQITIANERVRPTMPEYPHDEGKTSTGLMNALATTAKISRLIRSFRGQRVILDADLATIYGVETRVLNQAVKRNADRFPAGFFFQLNAAEKLEVTTNCDHLAGLKFARSLPLAFTEHGAWMAATVLNSPPAVKMRLFIIRAFVKLREDQAVNAAILKRLAEIDHTMLQHDTALRDIYQELLPLLAPPPDPPHRRIGFQVNPEKPAARVRTSATR